MQQNSEHINSARKLKKIFFLKLNLYPNICDNINTVEAVIKVMYANSFPLFVFNNNSKRERKNSLFSKIARNLDNMFCKIHILKEHINYVQY